MKLLYLFIITLIFGLMVLSLVGDDLMALIFNGFLLLFNLIVYVSNAIIEELKK